MCMPEHRENDLLARIGSESEKPADMCDFLRVRIPLTYDSLPMGYLSLDRAGRIVDINRVAARILGYREDELTGMDFFELLDPEDLRIMEKSGYRILDMETVSQINLRIRNDSGRTWIKAFVMETDFSDQQALSLIFSDITAQKQTEKELGWQLRVTREIDAITDAINQPELNYSQISRIVLTAAADLTQSADGFIARLPETFHSTVEIIFEQIYPEQCRLTSSSMTLSLNGGSENTASFLSRAIHTGKPFFTTGSAETSGTRRLPGGHIPMQGILAFPLLFNRQPRKLLVLANPATPYSQEMIKMLTRLAKLYSIALKLELSG